MGAFNLWPGNHIRPPPPKDKLYQLWGAKRRRKHSESETNEAVHESSHVTRNSATYVILVLLEESNQ